MADYASLESDLLLMEVADDTEGSPGTWAGAYSLDALDVDLLVTEIVTTTPTVGAGASIAALEVPFGLDTEKATTTPGSPNARAFHLADEVRLAMARPYEGGNTIELDYYSDTFRFPTPSRSAFLPEEDGEVSHFRILAGERTEAEAFRFHEIVRTLDAAELTAPPRRFYTGWENYLDDFAGYYFPLPGEYGSTHGFSDVSPRAGGWSHRAEVLVQNDVDNESTPAYVPHRAYFTFNPWKAPGGSYRTPVWSRLWIKVEGWNLINRPVINDWFSPMTFSHAEDDVWDPVVTAGVDPDRRITFQHVPVGGQQVHIFKYTDANDPTGLFKMPLNTWFRLDWYLNFSNIGGYVKMWLNGGLVAHAAVADRQGRIANFHGGLYASAAVGPGFVVWNDDWDIREVSNEAEAMILVNTL